MRISACSSDGCSSDLPNRRRPEKVRNLCVVALCHVEQGVRSVGLVGDNNALGGLVLANPPIEERSDHSGETELTGLQYDHTNAACFLPLADYRIQESARSEEHTSELQSLMRIAYAVFCLNKKKT